jgi:hypothetical protein
MTPEEMARRVLDLIREGKVDDLVIKLNMATRDRMKDQEWNLHLAHGPAVRDVQLPDA